LMQDPKMMGLAILMGIVPSLFWLWFWLKEDKEDPEPTGLLTFCFFIGMAIVVITIPIQKYIQSVVTSSEVQIVLWAGTEELLKYLVVVLLLSRTKYLDKPIDWPIFLITVALGFAAFENILFLVKPLSIGQAAVGLMTGQLRFLGSTLLHTVASGMVGLAIGLSFYMGNIQKKLYLIIGILVAITLHSAFNFFIMSNNGSDFLKVFAFLWVATIINLLLFEKLRRMSGAN
ncbi:MAG: PrsW family glutamic-type intramembrane protease, partial [bacterium]